MALVVGTLGVAGLLTCCHRLQPSFQPLLGLCISSQSTALGSADNLKPGSQQADCRGVKYPCGRPSRVWVSALNQLVNMFYEQCIAVDISMSTHHKTWRVEMIVLPP